MPYQSHRVLSLKLNGNDDVCIMIEIDPKPWKSCFLTHFSWFLVIFRVFWRFLVIFDHFEKFYLETPSNSPPKCDFRKLQIGPKNAKFTFLTKKWQISVAKFHQRVNLCSFSAKMSFFAKTAKIVIFHDFSCFLKSSKTSKTLKHKLFYLEKQGLLTLKCRKWPKWPKMTKNDQKWPFLTPKSCFSTYAISENSIEKPLKFTLTFLKCIEITRFWPFFMIFDRFLTYFRCFWRFLT